MRAIMWKCAASLAFFGLLLSAERGAACSYWHSQLDVVPDDNDKTPPEKPTVELVKFHRHKEEETGCRASDSSCGDHPPPMLVLKVTSSDDVSPESEVGFELKVHGDVELYDAILAAPLVATEPEGLIFPMWDDKDPSAAVSFELEVWAVDKAGNRSLESARIPIHMPGDSDGCSARGRGASGWLLWTLLLGFVLRRNQRLRARA